MDATARHDGDELVGAEVDVEFFGIGDIALGRGGEIARGEAVARGDLNRKITVDVKGEILELKNTINTMVDQLNGFASEVTRVAREVGTEGKLGGQAQVPGVAGTWKDLTDSVNAMCGNLTDQVRNIAEVTTAVARGDLSKKITVNVSGEILQLKETINVMVDQLRAPYVYMPRAMQKLVCPTITRLGDDGVRFTHYYTVSNDCTPARAAQISGLYTHQIGIFGTSFFTSS